MCVISVNFQQSGVINWSFLSSLAMLLLSVSIYLLNHRLSTPLPLSHPNHPQFSFLLCSLAVEVRSFVCWRKWCFTDGKSLKNRKCTVFLDGLVTGSLYTRVLPTISFFLFSSPCFLLPTYVVLLYTFIEKLHSNFRKIQLVLIYAACIQLFDIFYTFWDFSILFQFFPPIGNNGTDSSKFSYFLILSYF